MKRMGNSKRVTIQAKKREKPYALHRNWNYTNIIIDLMF